LPRTTWLNLKATSNGRDSGFGLARPMLERRLARAKHRYTGVSTDYYSTFGLAFQAAVRDSRPR